MLTPHTQGGQTDVIDLPDDDTQAVELMVHYFYHLDYPHVPLQELSAEKALKPRDTNPTIPTPKKEETPKEEKKETPKEGKKKTPKKKKKKTPKMEETQVKTKQESVNPKVAQQAGEGESSSNKAPDLIIHAKVFAVAEKYCVDGLKAVSYTHLTLPTKA